MTFIFSAMYMRLADINRISLYSHEGLQYIEELTLN